MVVVVVLVASVVVAEVPSSVSNQRFHCRDAEKEADATRSSKKLVQR